jgi:hypothetical protein
MPLVSYYTTARPAEELLVEIPASNTIALTTTNYCSPTIIAANALSSLQFWGSDAFVVRDF